MLIEQPYGRCKWKSLFGHSLQFQANLRLCLESPFRFMSTSTGQPDIDHHALSDIATWGQCIMKTKQSPETKGGDVAQLVEHRPVTPLTPWCGKGFSPRVNFQCRLSHVCPYTSVCHGTHYYLSASEIDLVVHVRARWSMETLKHPACTVRWLARHCRSWLSPGKQPEFPMG